MGINPGNPAFGLPPAEDSFARQLKDLERTTRENLASVVRSFKSTVDDLRATQATLATAQSDLATAQSDLATQQGELADAQSTLNTTVGRLDDTIATQDQTIADLQDVVNAQVSPKVANGSGSGFYVSPSFTTVASATIAVPGGYTRALVFASGQVTGGNNDALDIAKLYAHILINGDAGPDSIVSMVNVGWNTATAFASESLTGLSGGNISIAIAAKTSGGTTSSTTAPWDNATLTVQAIFLR